jgi:hypothetical protein
MIIQEPPQQLAAVTVNTLLKLGVREPGRVRAVQEADQRLKLLVARAEPGRSHGISRRATADTSKLGCTIAITLPGRQDSIPRGAKFATTGVEIGGHVGHLRGRR